MELLRVRGGPTSSSSGWVVCVVGRVSGNEDSFSQ
jgi:hypothetical protein